MHTRQHVKKSFVVKAELPMDDDVSIQLEATYHPAYPLITHKKNGDPGDEPPSPEKLEDIIAHRDGAEYALSDAEFANASDALFEQAHETLGETNDR